MAVASNSPLAKAIQGTPMGFNPGGLVKSRGPLPIPGLADEGPGTPAWEQLHAKELAGDAIAAANAGHVRTFPGHLSPLGPPSGPFGGPGDVMRPAPNPTVSGTAGPTPSLATPPAAPPVKGTPVKGTPAWTALHAKELAGDAIAAANAGHVRTFPGNLENGTPAFAPAAKSNNYGASSAGDKAIAAAQKDLAANEAALKKSQMGRTPGR